jgi:hypothetical protein
MNILSINAESWCKSLEITYLKKKYDHGVGVPSSIVFNRWRPQGVRMFTTRRLDRHITWLKKIYQTYVNFTQTPNPFKLQSAFLSGSIAQCCLLLEENMEQTLAKIRPHTSSSLAHQRTPATLLLALESTFKEQKTEPSSTAYFAALLTTLDGTLQKRDLGLDDGDILPAELYLLALVAPFVSTPVIRTNLNTLLSLTAPLFPLLNRHAPALRSQLTLYHVILQSPDRSQLEKDGIRQTFASILQLCLDPRPKVRKKAADVVKDVLSAPPSPLARHPYANRVAEWVKSALADVNAGPFPRSKLSGESSEAPATETAIHILAFLQPVLLNLPPSVSVNSICLQFRTLNIFPSHFRR